MGGSSHVSGGHVSGGHNSGGHVSGGWGHGCNPWEESSVSSCSAWIPSPSLSLHSMENDIGRAIARDLRVINGEQGG